MISENQAENNPQTQTKLTLKQFRKEILGMSQTEFAEALGSTQNTIARYEAGRHTLRLTLEQICLLENLLKSHGLTFQNLIGLGKK